MITVICSILLATAMPESGSVSSTNAAYDGQNLVLTGHVVLDHGMGRMTAEQASLEKQEAGKDFPFSVIHLQKDVLLQMKNDAELHCHEADLDFTTLKGQLKSTSEDKVKFIDKFKRKGGREVLFHLISPTVELAFTQNVDANKKNRYDIETIFAKDQVTIDYANSFILQADHAVFRQEKLDKTPNKDVHGLVTAYPKDEQSKCHLAHEGDLIDADLVELDLNQSILTLQKPQGSLLTPLIPHLQKGKLEFLCDHLRWNDLKHLLMLKGHVQVVDNAMGTILADEELQIEQSLFNGKRLLKSIRTKGRTTIEYEETSNENLHRLVCHGSFVLDRDKLQALLESPETGSTVPREKQIYYEENDIGVHADKAMLEYSIIGNLFQPVSLVLRGNIVLFSRDPQKPQRCGIADRVSYSPSTRTLILAANPNKKVLFSDEEENLRISASEVHLIFDPATQKRTVKGVGNVQFTFTPEETNLLQTIIPSFLKPHAPKR